MKITHPVIRAAFGIAALAVIAVSANWLVSLTPLGNRGIDFTEKKIHTLSDGTRAILGELDTPVVIRYYASRSTDYMPEQMKLHMRRVDDMLKEYATLSDGKLRVENLDPQPDTDAEDSANLDGISGQRINDQNLYFGLAISCIDRTSVIPFLDPRDETMLEYRLSKAVSEVSTPVKPKVAIISAFDLKGAPAMMPGQRPQPPWVIHQQLQQSFDLVDLPMSTTHLDPAEVKTVVLLHPAGISKELEFALDQFVLKGGTVIAALDAHSVAAQMLGGGNPMMGGGGIPVTSTLPTLLPAWGVTFESKKVVADPTLATKLDGNRSGIAVLTLTDDQMTQADNVVTKDLGSLVFFLPGGFTSKGGAGVAVNSLVRTGPTAGLVDSSKAAQIDPSLATSFRADGTRYDMVLRLSGKFKTAFPEGKPAPEGKKAAEKRPDDPEPLKEASAEGNVFLIADADAFFDRFAYAVQNYGGMQVANPLNGNPSLLLNLLDQAVGSKHLIGSRSRTAIRRPFTVVQKMESEFNEKVGAQIQELEAKARETQEKLSVLQAQKSQSNELFLSPEQEAEIRALRKQQVNYAKLVREQEKELRRQKDKLGGKITLLNIAGMPLLVIICGTLLYFGHRARTRAR
ncbi:MAG: Gldg family protein [Verrucomicrobiota bacterium]